MKHENFILILLVPVMIGIFYLAFRPQKVTLEVPASTTGTDE